MLDTRFPLLVPLLLALPFSLQANSYLLRGVILQVAKGDDKVPCTVTLRGVLGTPADVEDREMTIKVGGGKFFLDDQPSDIGALAPGRMLFLCQDVSYYRVFSRSYHFPAGEAADPGEAWWLITISQLAPCPANPEAKKPRGPGDLMIHLRTQAGKVVSTAAITPGWGASYGSGTPWHEVDASGLVVKDGVLEGSCKVTLKANLGSSFPDQKDTLSLSFALSVQKSGKGSATVSGRPPVTATASCRALPTIPKDWYAFLRAPGACSPATGDSRPHAFRIGFRLRDGKAESDCQGGGKLGGTEKPQSVTASLEDGKLKAKLDLAIGKKKAVCDLDAFIIGERFFGTCAFTCEEKTWAVRASGYLQEVDAPTIAWGEGDAKKGLKALEGNSGKEAANKK